MLSTNIVFEKIEYRLGESIPVSITYRNAGGSSVKREDPRKSLNAEMHVVDRKTKEDFTFTMGKIEVTQLGTDVDEYALVEPIPDDVEIEAEGELSFVADLNQRLYLRPGEFDCELRDRAIVSNRQTLSIRYTRESVDLLFSLVRDASRDYSRREWAADWLRKVAPKFDFRLTLDTESAEVKRRNEDANRPVYDAFMKWWIANRNSKEVTEKLVDISILAR
jgi:hypothetical protein